MAFARWRGTGDGSNDTFSLPFSYISETHVYVKVDGVDAPFSFLTVSTIKLDTVPANGASVFIYRETPREDAVVDYTNGSVLSETQLDLQTTQLLFIAQEAFDTVEDAIGTDASNNWDAQGRRITNASDAVDDTDVPTYGQIKTAEETAISKAAAASSSASAASASETAAVAAQGLAEDAQAAAEAAEDGAVAAQGLAEDAQAAAEGARDTAVSSSAAAVAAADAAALDSTATAADRVATAADRSASETARTEAESARDAAEAALDQFTDIYLGAYASDPTLNNDGDALVAGNLYFNTVTESLRVYGAGGWQEYAATSGKLAQAKSLRITASSSIPTNIPADNTIPQSGEGAELGTLAITPTSSSSTIRVSGEVFCTLSAYTNGIAALFKDAEVSAFATGMRTSNNGDMIEIRFSAEFVAGTTSPITIKLRAGAATGTMYVNRFTTGDTLGGTLVSSLIVEEILP